MDRALKSRRSSPRPFSVYPKKIFAIVSSQGMPLVIVGMDPTTHTSSVCGAVVMCGSSFFHSSGVPVTKVAVATETRASEILENIMVVGFLGWEVGRYAVNTESIYFRPGNWLLLPSSFKPLLRTFQAGVLWNICKIQGRHTAFECSGL